KDRGLISRGYGCLAIPQNREFLVRRVASIASPESLNALITLLSETDRDPKEQRRILQNILAGLQGRRRVKKPAGWEELSEKQGLHHAKDAELRSLARSLAVVFGDENALRLLRQELTSAEADLPSRRAALTSLLDAHDKALAPLLQKLIGDK